MRRKFGIRSDGLAGLPLLLLLLGMGVFAGLKGEKVRSGGFLIGDCPYYASATVSLWADGDLDLRNQLRGGLEVHGRQVALGRRGEWYPKHPILLSVLSVPFYALLGVAGFLVFNLLELVGLLCVTWALCRRHAPPGIATTAASLVLGGTFLRAYIYNFSPDLLSALLVLAGLLLVLEHRVLAGGLVLGVSALAKVTNLFSVAIVVIFLAVRGPRRETVRALVGLLPGLLILCLLNAALFGSPTVFGYDRTLVLQNGIPMTLSHRGFFDLPVWEGMRGQLFSPRVGLLPTSPVLLLAVPGFLLLLRRQPWEGLLLFSLSEFTFLFFSTYRWWATSHYGNRFLMVPVCLAALPIAYTLEWVWKAVDRLPLPHNLTPSKTGGR